jgi:hypothetical protein
MSYFRELPNVEFENFLENSTGSQDYILLKNIFIRGKLRDDLQNVFTIFNKYEIEDDERPDQIADDLYGDPFLDWVVLVTANIINFQNQWPLTNQQLYDYVENKYGVEKMNATKYYKTKEIRRKSDNTLILPADLTVGKDFSIPDPDVYGNIIYPATGVSNYQYETELNDAKRLIYVLRPEYLQQFVKDMRDISKYGFNSEFVDNKTIRVTNSKVLSP